MHTRRDSKSQSLQLLIEMQRVRCCCTQAVHVLAECNSSQVKLADLFHNHGLQPYMLHTTSLGTTAYETKKGALQL